MSLQERRIAVIGAGAAGLCAAKHLLAAGADVTVFELGSRVGGLWVYENDNGRSPAYASLHINSEQRVTGYADFPFPPGTPLYPTHDRVAGYLDAYADAFGVRPHIRFRTAVTRVEPAGPAGSGWRVSLGDGSVESFDDVVVACGHQGAPAHPAYAADFTGSYLHAHAYRVPEPFRDKRVLVVGVGNSALDIASDICTVTASTTLVARSPVLIMPRMLFGVPTARVLAKIEKPWLPWPVARTIRELLSRFTFGRMEQWGFVTPKKRTHPASHPAVMGHVAWERIKIRPGVARVQGTEVEFVDGATESFDTMIAATGYEIDLPFLPAELSPVRERRVELYRRIVLPDTPGLYFVGFFNVSGGANIAMMDVQCRWLVAVAAGQVALPDAEAMRRAIQAEWRTMARLYPASPRYGMELEPRAYQEAINADLAGAPASGRLPGLSRVGSGGRVDGVQLGRRR
ncbi:MAG: NAD(P)-binding domain-containing protein [Mycobacteriales bacterium]